MKIIDPTIREPVKRADAENYLLITLLVFAGSVIATRLFLQMTGFPRLGNDVLHIAHALWGGLFLMISAILPMIFVNRWVFNLSAALNGVGIGLFIDEVGKFITANNDYFYPPAAPLIYASFLMLALVYFFVKKPNKPEPRTALYHALADLQELADNNLDPLELSLLVERLCVAKKSDQPHIAGLAEAIEVYLKKSEVPLVPAQPVLSKQVAIWLRSLGEKIGRKPLRLLILGTMTVMALNVIVSIISLIAVAISPTLSIQDFWQTLLIRIGITGSTVSIWQLIRFSLELIIGALMLASVIMILDRKEIIGMHTGMIALLLSLTGLLLLNFYLDQFRALSVALVQFPFLLLIIAYRRWYVSPPEV